MKFIFCKVGGKNTKFPEYNLNNLTVFINNILINFLNGSLIVVSFLIFIYLALFFIFQILRLFDGLEELFFQRFEKRFKKM